MNRRQLAGVALAATATAPLLALLVLLTYGTRWGHELYLFPYAIGAATLPFVAAVATERYRLVLPTLLLPVGVLAFVGGVVAGGGCLQAAGEGWYFTYDPVRNVIRYGGSVGTCRAEPNAPVVLLGYALTAVGGLQTLDAVTARTWSPLDLSALPGASRFAP
ncbi:hypothetical protein [Halorubellus sp. PRR65]|uniref:hypothetical protein n=1 Tax=Halorubellus sp. PRR65 TaxID=3098148 RepID=UPI002B257F5E|nr:hypothetical protein [Halorubellus sp. PRR65]